MHSPWLISFFLHAVLVLGFVVASLTFFDSAPNKAVVYDFEVIEKKVETTKEPIQKKEQQAIDLEVKKEDPPSEPEKPVERVFGLSNEAVQSDQEGGVSVKAGNTLTKEQDDVEYDGQKGLPTPMAEYLVSQMPVLLKEVKPRYTQKAKDNNIEGKVVLKILIDEKGKVRTADLIEALGYGLDEAALEAIMQFEFQPAIVDQENVAVEVRYVISFELR